MSDEGKRATNSGTRTRNLFLRREAPYPLGHIGFGTSLAQLLLLKPRSKLWLVILAYQKEMRCKCEFQLFRKRAKNREYVLLRDAVLKYPQVTLFVLKRTCHALTK